MNLEKIFSALDADEMNSALGILCLELEAQGYTVEVEGIQVTANEVLENKFPSLEEVTDSLNIVLSRNGKTEQKFAVDFTAYHQITFKEFAGQRK